MTGPAPSRIELRLVEPADLDVFFDHTRDAEARHMAAFVSRDPDDRQAFDAHWSRVLGNPAILARTILADGTVVGHVIRFETDGRPEITYWIDRAWWGRGVATRALAAFLAEIRERPVFARAAQDNVGSIRVLERNGFVPCGEERGYAHGRGETIDEVVLVLGEAAEAIHSVPGIV